MIRVIDKEVLSSDKTHMLKGKIYIPEGSAKGMFHVVHSMTDHIGRYDDFMRQIAEEGFIVFGYDHLGHGMTALNYGELGFFAHENGWEKLVDDVFLFGNEIRKAMGGELPFILMGHSMGSFIVRLAAAKYNHWDKLILMATSSSDHKAGLGIKAAGILKKLKGERHISKYLYKMAFGDYNKNFEDERDNFAWLSTQIEVRDNYRLDKFCTFLFSVSAMQDLFRLMKYSNDKKWFSEIDKQKPIYLISGAEDPTGDYGAGVTTVYVTLKAAGATVDMKIYPNVRHEILNDTSRRTVIWDIKAFIK